MKEDSEIHIEFLDHVAIYVRDLKVSSEWYQRVLGLKKYELPKWGAYPIFLLSGKSGVALFPAQSSDARSQSSPAHVRIDHFAFHVTHENFEKAKSRYAELNLKFNTQDHYYFHSIYTKDPDGHTVELTTLVVDEKDFYR